MVVKNGKELNEDNAEEIIENAIQKYFDTGMIVDALFWKAAIGFLKKKLLQDFNKILEKKIEKLR